jgi:sterol desaturase/sphingolipid hydroxylase (fatty acid hydroxylase superfamily)
MDAFLHEISHFVFSFVFSKVNLVLALLLVGRLVVLTALEKRDPAHSVSYREVLPRDIFAWVMYGIVVYPAAMFLNRWIMYRPPLPQSVLEWPLAIRILFYVVLADLGFYWIHRWLHTRYLWPAHKWHHCPTYMYWLAGVRGSVVQQTLVNVPYIAAGVFLDVAPWWMFWAILVKNIAQNDFMHLNVPWGNRWLEWIIITPRYHHVHHSDNPAHYRNNLAGLFPIWDHAFGTYLDPEKVPRKLTFGIGDSAPAVRLLIGI